MSRGATITDTRTTPPKTASASEQAENSSKLVSNSLRNTGPARRLRQKVFARPSDRPKQKTNAHPPGLGLPASRSAAGSSRSGSARLGRSQKDGLALRSRVHVYGLRPPTLAQGRA